MRIIVCLFVFLSHVFCCLSLDAIHRHPDIFEHSTFSFRTQKFPRPHVSGYKTNLPVHTYPDIFESAIFSLLGPSWIFNIHGKELVDLLTRFMIHRGLKNLHSGERIQKVADSSAGYTGYAWTEAESGDSKYPDTCERGLNWYSETPLCDMVMGHKKRDMSARVWCLCIWTIFSSETLRCLCYVHCRYENWKESFKTANWFLTFKEKDSSKWGKHGFSRNG